VAAATLPARPPATPAAGTEASRARASTDQDTLRARTTPIPRARPGPAAVGRPRPAAATPAAAAPGPRAPVFGSSDPKARAQRIARALVSDIVAYHKKRVEEALAGGRLRTEFRDEIMKSWDEYVAQVGLELAKGTPFFRDALNEILARGQRVF
jgi:hypothetical protein